MSDDVGYYRTGNMQNLWYSSGRRPDLFRGSVHHVPLRDGVGALLLGFHTRFCCSCLRMGRG